MKVSKTVRALIKAHIAASNKYDADTMRISVDGLVSAKYDQNKTGIYDNRLWLVGYVNGLMEEIEREAAA